ncbi:hypothetical protein VTN31DRAFT_3915 [Thermomyces dupontii]|uniref:uncharacterized protein n=1 Tax=Talaromyces thermophilus TaxID=28565 RepID=UPI003743A29C
MTDLKQSEGTNPRGIPKAPFVENVTDYVSSRADVEPTLRSFQELISKYQFMELNTQRRGAGLRQKIPDIRNTLEMVRYLRSRREAADSGADNHDDDDDDDDADQEKKLIQTTFELNDTLYAHATVDPKDTNEVYLWLGANVMLAYPIEEAEAMLAEKLAAAEKSLAACEEDLEFLREQITTLEVATARVYNWDVVQRRKEKEEGKEADGS